jgi:ribosome-binding factor A
MIGLDRPSVGGVRPGRLVYSRAAMPSARMRRINEVLREVIGAAIATDLSDPRIGFVTVTSVETSPDLRSARVFVSVLGSEEEREATLAVLRSSHGVLQSRIAAETRMKRTPTLTFRYDETIEQGVRISRLLESEDE